MKLQKVDLNQNHTEKHTMVITDCPVHSPDLNIIQTVWGRLDRKWNKSHPASKEKL